MARVFTPALSDFSTGLVGALDEHAAEVSGSRPPALNLKERGQARQAFMGSIIGLNDGSVHLVAVATVKRGGGDDASNCVLSRCASIRRVACSSAGTTSFHDAPSLQNK